MNSADDENKTQFIFLLSVFMSGLLFLGFLVGQIIRFNFDNVDVSFYLLMLGMMLFTVALTIISFKGFMSRAMLVSVNVNTAKKFCDGTTTTAPSGKSLEDAATPSKDCEENEDTGSVLQN